MAHQVIVEKKEMVDEKNRFKYAADLEAGALLFFPEIPFELTAEEINGFVRKDAAALHRYSQKVERLLESILSPYAGEWAAQEARFLSLDEGKICFDANEYQPLHGGRLLRFFMNIHPSKSKQWVTSESFTELIKKFGGKEVPFPKSPSYSFLSRLFRRARKAACKIGLQLPLRSPYDAFMLQLKTYLRKSESFQKECPKKYWDFPPNSCWALFGDQIPYASLSTDMVLEKSFIIPQRALLFPEKSPLAALERLTNSNMINVDYSK